MGVEVRLTSESIDNGGDIYFSRCVQIAQFVVIVRWVLLQEEIYIVAIHKFGQYLYVSINIPDSLIYVNRFCI